MHPLTHSKLYMPRSRVIALLLALATVGGVALGAWRFVGWTSGPVKNSTSPGVLGTLSTHNSSGRTGSYFLPALVEGRPLPLLVALHGTGGNGAQMVALFRESAEREPFIVVAPDSMVSPEGQATWRVGDHPGDFTEDFDHVRQSVDEVLHLPGVVVDMTRVLVAGHSGGGSTAPYFASNVEPCTTFAVLHGGVFPGGLGPRRMRGWFSTGDADFLRPPDGVRRAADDTRRAGFDDVVYREFHEGHDVGLEEVAALINWWLRP
jgi:phospholipase/carboxylesterase